MARSLKHWARWTLWAALTSVSLAAAAADKYPVVLRLDNDTQVSGDLIRYADGYFELQTERGVLKVRQDQIYTIDFGAARKTAKVTWKPGMKDPQEVKRECVQKLSALPTGPQAYDGFRILMVSLNKQANDMGEPDLPIQVLEEAIQVLSTPDQRWQRLFLKKELQIQYAAKGDAAKARQLEQEIREEGPRLGQHPLIQKLLQDRPPLGREGTRGPKPPQPPAR